MAVSSCWLTPGSAPIFRLACRDWLPFHVTSLLDPAAMDNEPFRRGEAAFVDPTRAIPTGREGLSRRIGSHAPSCGG